jgi:hypothetical protein
MTFEELRQNVGAKDLSFAGKVQKAFPAEQKDGNYGPYYTQNLLMLDSADEKAYVRLQLKSETEQITQAGQVLAVKVTPSQGRDGKIYFNGKLGVTAPKPQPKPAPANGTAPKANGFADNEETKLRSMCASYAKDIIVAGITNYTPDNLRDIADDFLAYIKGQKPAAKPATNQQPSSFDQYVMDNPPADEDVPF